MKVLVFPALLAIAIFTTPPKPFATVPAGKPLSAATTAAKPGPTPLGVANSQQQTTSVSKAEAGTLTPEENVTARR